MGIHLEMVNMDETFQRLPYSPIVINDYNTSIPEQQEMLDKHFYTHYQETDTIEDAASCHCRNPSLRGMYNEGVICPICHTPVRSTTSQPIESTLWIRAPDGVDALIHPELWIILHQAMNRNDFNYFEYLLNTDYRTPSGTILSKQTTILLNKLKDQNPPRGLNSFVKHFDQVMQAVFAAGIIGGSKSKTNKQDIWEYIEQNRAVLFPKHLPLPSRVCFVVESSPTARTYIDSPLGTGINALLSITSITATSEPLTVQKVQNRTVLALKELMMFYENYTKDRIAGKPGILRRHEFGARLNYSARGVITSLSDPHDRNELHLPWGMACQLFKYHLCNKLSKRGMTPNDMLRYIYSRVMTFDPLLDELFKEIISEARGPGPVAMFQRNPTLQRGSTQRFFITKIKTDVRDNTVSMSALVLRAPNADFDGDQLNLILIPDNQLEDAVESLSPDNWVFSIDKPEELSNNLELQGPVVDTIATWLHADYLEPQKT